MRRVGSSESMKLKGGWRSSAESVFHLRLTGCCYTQTPDYKQGYERFGLTVNERGDITYREWAPNAVEAHLIGDFSTRATEP